MWEGGLFMALTQAAQTYCRTHREELFSLIKDLCAIPAPAGAERSRAEFCKKWLERHGAPAVCLDDAENAVLELNAQGQTQLTVFMAHTDTVFPDVTTLPFQEDMSWLYCPGVYDDTANLAVLLMAARFLLEQGIRPAHGMLIAADSGEEGLGNLKGCRRLMETYRSRVARVISFDLTYDELYHQAVGSSRYRITVRTQGGHSYFDYGRPSAIAQLARMVSDLYAIPIPEVSGSKTTCNVGVIEGGTSVNTIAQEASLLYEYRSDSADCLGRMEQAVQSLISIWRAEGLQVEAAHLGTRPCSGAVDPACQRALAETCRDIICAHTGQLPALCSGSTDCNIPLSLGIPAVSFGLCRGAGAHTREEWLEKASLQAGLEIALDVMLHFCA